MSFPNRLRSLAWFLVAAVYYIVAQQVAFHSANGLSSGDWFELVHRSMLLFLLLAGFAAMGYVGQRQQEPLKAMGLVLRPGWRKEFALGSAIGWGGVVACVLPVALIGGLVVTFFTTWHQFRMILLDLLVLAIAALLEEVAFRGYPFQRLIDAIGPNLATLVMCLIFGAAHLRNPAATGASTLVTILAGWLLSLAYLRTRALWVGWGFHFAWNASMAVLFGLPMSGITDFSPVILTNARGPAWLTGDGYGPEGSLLAVLVLLALLVVMVKATRDLKHLYAQPVIIPGGIPVDIDAAARRQHETAMASPAVVAEPKLVQILPASGGSFPLASSPASDTVSSSPEAAAAERPAEESPENLPGGDA
ncbi:CPBP family intramembrane glutamic endopeptidase [Paracidobacterium acidisoli]|uniref:CPBP family intramembrane metalloprotease n=1 Tax=Paracidobacterium acidisoli TaxID=2303751 RepID=A0A372ISN4_9BACT|nr:CPBP family intramembrane glutamic endopeptidase [Paracidobacterium acidisoli]MBT9330400.1 CPBP family intramembrane metalloprotease [Paracidobacterium acidisoli]